MQKKILMKKSIYQTLGATILAPYIGVTRQRASVMIHNPDAGDNGKRLRSALLKLWKKIGEELENT